ncbi:chemotaxis-specific protein-glutamate methyltransferase CheB [Acetivibrio cellulolyticus]|uniref:chemotaxis-specific protein-glutamate methyltransferase CheB n=1 Tax=Acetivibrio cellulolyticus TaxID=35830 RepID=UPI0001E2F0C9|nr:chemotaxis-specific protein-glutamate methyltransferase CheB [Acetivibrio cellulolyticus]
MEKIRVLIADDSIMYRKVLSEAVEGTGLADVKFVALNGRMAVDWIKPDSVDLILLDVFMPEMNGIEALKIIKKDYPGMDVIMISSDSAHSAELTMEALNNGAVDFILKPSNESHEKCVEIIKAQLQILFTQIKIRKYRNSSSNGSQTMGFQNIRKKEIEKSAVDIVDKFNASKFTRVDLILIASSTGGPSALEKVLHGFDADFNKPILVVQHMPPKFTKSLSDSLNRKCKLEVKEACENDLLQKGQIFIAPGGFHMLVKGEGPNVLIKTETTQYVNGVRPSADVLFSSAASLFEGKNILAVVLTGMGSDGKNGVIELKQKCNCYCITQSEKTCVVYGMPKSIYEAGLSDEVVDIENISKRIQEIVSGKGIRPN